MGDRLRRSGAAVLGAAAVVVGSGDLFAAEPVDDAECEERCDSGARLTPLWLLAQLAPSPEIAYGDRAARFGMRWQVTPLLYSFGLNPRASRWRVLLAEPVARQSGSIELYFGPEYLKYGASFADGWLWRTGVRSYFPLVERGDYVSVSIGASHYVFAGRAGVAYEAGVYVLFGTVGAQITWSPTGGPAAAIATFRLRYF